MSLKMFITLLLSRNSTSSFCWVDLFSLSSLHDRLSKRQITDVHMYIWKLYIWSINQTSGDTCCDIVDVQDEWSATWAAGDGADEVLPDALSEWLWDWWLRVDDYLSRHSVHNRQVQTCRTLVVCSAVVSLLELAYDTYWLATVTNTCMAETPAEETHPMWVYIHTLLFIKTLAINVSVSLYI